MAFKEPVDPGVITQASALVGDKLVWDGTNWIPYQCDTATGSITDNSTLTVTHTVDILPQKALVAVYEAITDWGAALVANFTSSVNADTGQTATANNGAAISAGFLELDGTNDYLTFPDDAAYTPGSSPWTLELDVQFDSTSGQQHVVNHAGPGELYAWAIVRNGSTLLCHAGATTNRDILNDVTIGTVGTSSVHQVALVWTGTHYYGYFDGSRAFDVASTSTVLNATGPITFGRPSSVSTEYLDGRIRRFRLTIGTARYTGSSYTPPSADFTTAISYSQLPVGTGGVLVSVNSGYTTITNDLGRTATLHGRVSS